MIIKLLYVLVIIIMSNSVVLSNKKDATDQDTIIQNECTVKEIKPVLKDKASIFIKSFNQLLGIMNHNFCKIDSITLRSYLIQIDTMYKRDSSYSDDDRRMFRKASSFLTRSITWDEEIEKIILKDMDFLKKNSKTIYYRRLWLFVERSPNWYQYMLETYNSIDTMNYSDRYWIYWALIERFKDTSDTSVQNKVESILYAVMKKDKSQSTLMMVDEYLSSKSDSYKNSRQRLQLFKDRDKKLEPIKDRNYLVGYFNYSLNIQKYLNKKWKLTDYVPPFTIE